MEKIKVAHIITLLELGGAQQNTLFTVGHLDRDKFDPLLICGRGGILDEEAIKIPGLKVCFVDEMIRSVHPWKDLLCLFRLTRILKNEKPQIVHTHSSKAGILGRIAAWLSGVPVVIHSIHGFGFNPYQKFIVRKLFILLERWISNITHRLIAVSNENIMEGIRLGIGAKEKYILIRSGIHIEEIREVARASDSASLRKELGIPDGHKIILKIAPFKVQKDPVAYVRVAGKVLRDYPDVVFLLSGDGELRPEIENTIKEGRLENKVKLLGWKRNVPELLKLCDLFVLTSLWEGLPRAGVEALILGKPIIAFAVDGIKEIIIDGENGFLIPPGSEDLMAEKIILTLNEPAIYKKFCENASKSIDSSFDINRMVLDQEKLYRELIKNQRKI